MSAVVGDHQLRELFVLLEENTVRLEKRVAELELGEDEKFVRDYTTGRQEGDMRRIAGILSRRLHDMDRRAAAANKRADWMEGRVKHLLTVWKVAPYTMAPPVDLYDAMLSLAAAARQSTSDERGTLFVLEHLNRTLDFVKAQEKALRDAKAETARAVAQAIEDYAEAERCGPVR